MGCKTKKDRAAFPESVHCELYADFFENEFLLSIGIFFFFQIIRFTAYLCHVHFRHSYQGKREQYLDLSNTCLPVARGIPLVIASVTRVIVPNVPYNYTVITEFNSSSVFSYIFFINVNIKIEDI